MSYDRRLGAGYLRCLPCEATGVIHDLYDDGTYLARCPDTGHSPHCGHHLLAPQAKVTWSYNAKSRNDAMRGVAEHLGHTFVPMLRDDGTPYPEDDALFDDAILDITSAWHDGAFPGKELHEALGWTWEQYGRWLEDPTQVPGRKEEP